MTQIMCIYKIKHKDDINNENIYIGRSLRFTTRRYSHRTAANQKKNTSKLYDYINNNGGIDNFIFEIIQELTNKNKHLIKEIEKEYIDIFKPRLNTNLTIGNIDNMTEYHRTWRKIKFVCKCGYVGTNSSKWKHLNYPDRCPLT